MIKLFLVLFSLVFIVLATPANAAEISGDISLVCPFGKPFFIGPMDPGKSFELLPGHTKIEKAKIEAHRKVLRQCLSQYGKSTKLTFVGVMDPKLYRGVRPEVHNGLNGGLSGMRGTGGAKIGREYGYLNITVTEMYGEEGQRGLLVIPDLGLCTAEDINGATRIVDEITGQILQKGQCKAILGQQLPAGRITKVKISLMGDETFDGSGKNIGLPTTKTCYVVVGTPVVVRKDPPVKPADSVPPVPVVAKELKCSDGVDNDKDGKIDCDDEDCAEAAICVRVPEDSAERCADGKDNDGDGFVDLEDKDCLEFGAVPTPTKERNCSDKVDNDGDGLTDCDDSDCKGTMACSSLRKFRFFVSGELRFGILDKTASGPFQGVEEVTSQIRTSDMFNGALTLGAYYPIKNGWSVGLELGGVTATNLYAFMGDTTLRGNVHQKKFLVRGGVLKQLNEDFAVGFQLGSYLDGDGYVPVGRLSLQISLTTHLKFEVSAAVENTRHVQSHENVWTPQIGAGLVYWF